MLKSMNRTHMSEVEESMLFNFPSLGFAPLKFQSTRDTDYYDIASEDCEYVFKARVLTTKDSSHSYERVGELVSLKGSEKLLALSNQGILLLLKNIKGLTQPSELQNDFLPEFFVDINFCYLNIVTPPEEESKLACTPVTSTSESRVHILLSRKKQTIIISDLTMTQ